MLSTIGTMFGRKIDLFILPFELSTSQQNSQQRTKNGAKSVVDIADTNGTIGIRTNAIMNLPKTGNSLMRLGNCPGY